MAMLQPEHVDDEYDELTCTDKKGHSNTVVVLVADNDAMTEQSINQSINDLHRCRHSVPLCPYHTSYYVVYIYFNYSLITVLRSVYDSGQCSLIIIFNCLAVPMFIYYVYRVSIHILWLSPTIIQLYNYYSDANMRSLLPTDSSSNDLWVSRCLDQSFICIT